jgi:hypothetical protein
MSSSLSALAALHSLVKRFVIVTRVFVSTIIELFARPQVSHEFGRGVG